MTDAHIHPSFFFLFFFFFTHHCLNALLPVFLFFGVYNSDSLYEIRIPPNPPYHIKKQADRLSGIWLSDSLGFL